MKCKLCQFPGCNQYAIKGSCYCEEHYKPSSEKHKAFESAIRRNQEFYNTSEWRNLRRTAIEEHPYCSLCGAPKEETQLTVDHVIPPEGDECLFFNITNLQVLCVSCHRIKTNMEIRNRYR